MRTIAASHPDPDALTTRVDELDGTIIAVRAVTRDVDPDTQAPRSWIVLWRRGWDSSFVTHRVYRHAPASLDAGHYDMTFNEALGDFRDRGAALSDADARGWTP